MVGRSQGSGILGWYLEGVGESFDGLPRCDHQSVPGTPDHSNGISSIDHVVVQTFDFAESIRAFNEAGLDDRRTRKFMVGGSERQQTFFWAGSVIVEMIGCVEPAEGSSTLWGLALVSDDLDSTASFLGELISQPKEAVQPGRRIATLRTELLDISLPVAIMTPHDRGISSDPT